MRYSSLSRFARRYRLYRGIGYIAGVLLVTLIAAPIVIMEAQWHAETRAAASAVVTPAQSSAPAAQPAHE